MMPLQRAKLLNSPCFNSFSHQWMKPTIVAVRAFSAASDHSNQSRGVRVQGDEFWHMTKVLRLKVKDRIELFNGKGGLVEGSIDRVDRAGLDFMAIKDPIIVHPHKPQWDVYAAFGTLKGGRADWLVEKCTLGASTVTPLLTERSPLISENRVERLQRVIIAATKQCKLLTSLKPLIESVSVKPRLHEMILNPPMEVGSILPTVAESISFVAAAEGTPVIRTLTSSANESRGSLIIGPEG
ncbi:Ribosomal RNA small subunit methyltransferase E, partial [Bienertia sinuspersici]